MFGLPLRNIGEAALDLCFPRHCFGCAAPLEREAYRYLCPACRGQFILLDGAHCPCCGAPYDGDIPDGFEPDCPRCRDLDPVFRGGRSIFLHRGIGRAVVLELKYRQGRYLVPDLMCLAARVPALLSGFAGATWVPVPLHPRKRRERGFNQSEWIARALSREVPDTSVRHLLQRVEDKTSQTRLRREERLANAKNAFAIAPKVNLDASDFFVLVDDVYTTGATLNACALALRHAGARHVAFLTLAHG